MTTILVVDDSAVDRRLVGGLLEKRFPWRIEYAADGVEALARMKNLAPDLIVTDLTMPTMDGLELVRSLRVHHPEVPVILMTAYGSEALAVEALAQGAASYVPKSSLAAKLADTVEGVLGLARASQSREQLMRCLVRTEFSFALENDPAMIDPLVDLVQQMIAGMKFTDFAGRLQISVAVKEALLNALFHGNLQITQQEIEAVSDHLLEENETSLVEQRRAQPPYNERKLFVDVKITGEEARFVIRDQGPGFDVHAVSGVNDQGNPELERGRGLSLMRTFMDQVIFNEAGSEVTLIKRRDPA
jgi:CheY-like chemotaxis protein/anti-sigma regulatory factor (Ser/Thr protein kinase)